MKTEQGFVESQHGGLAVITKLPQNPAKDNPFEMTLDEAFPSADPGCKPLGNKVLVQLRSAKKRTASGIHLATETQDQEKFITTVAKVIAVGPIAYHRRDTGEAWPEGTWVKAGDFVRVPKFGGDRWEMKVDDVTEARFAVYNDYDFFSIITGDPLQFKDYV